MSRFARSLFAVLLLLAAWQSRADTVMLGDEPSYPLSRSFSYLEDAGGMLQLEDVLRPDTQAKFKPLAPLGPGPNFGLTRSAFWLKVSLDVPAGVPRDWLLEVAYPPLDHINLFSPDQAFGFQQQVGGDNEPFAARELPHRNHVFPVRVYPGTSSTIYLRVQSEGTVSAPVRLWQPRALWAHDQQTYATLALYFGLLGGLLLYNLLLWVSVRDRAYLVYVAFVASMGVGQAALSGLGAQFLWPEWTWWTGVSVPVGLSAAAILGLQFARSFLSSAARMPKLDKVLLAQMAGWGIALLAALSVLHVAAWMVTVLAVVSVATMAAIGYISIRREYAGARWFFTAWAMLLLGVGLLSLHDTGVLPSNALTSNALLIGSALEMVLLSFALGDRINVARRFKEQAQARIAAEHAMVEVLSESQERLKQVLEEREVILENSLVGIAFLTPQGRFKWANKAMLDIFGADRNSIISMEPFYESREQYLRVGHEVAAAVARGDVYERELPVRRIDGTRIWIQLSGKAASRSDLALGTVWGIMDITERKQLEEQLRSTMSEREAILNNAVMGIVLSVNRRHEWVNEKFAQMLGYPRQILIGQSSMYIHPDEESWLRFGVEARAALIATNGYTHERRLRRRNGELFWVEMGGSCVRPHDPDSGVIWTFLDITEKKKSADEVREALEQQKALNELRTRFVAMTSHEFRTPLAAILSAEEVLRHYGDRLPQSERLATLDDIASGVQRMSRMMDRILLLGQADARMLDFVPGSVDLPGLCRKLVEEARAQHPDTRCEVSARWAAGVGQGQFDEKLLRHIFGNLLSNAVKYSPAGGKVLLTVRPEGREMVFEVADQGIGIPAEEVQHLFESFHRASNVGAIQGTGLGLAIVKNAVEVHHGRIEVHSELGRGTRFIVRLPLQPEPVAAA
ncbi:sensor histidine kinase [Ramlibacter humi]|uniref:histidine kinase n=1 Tax=Ramlibacter humi TaxID=2530451 RepID=A0A4Z0C8M9_9BURK|nr:7TM diverse intracellular signaling domain-containing protein [Ramlibacter humi]TFZ07973.1 PAS domain S-box protein [Ramlibacter humi]